VGKDLMESVLKIIKYIYHKNINLKIYLKTLIRRIPGRKGPGRVIFQGLRQPGLKKKAAQLSVKPLLGR
jgi:hypothetical protein